MGIFKSLNSDKSSNTESRESSSFFDKSQRRHFKQMEKLASKLDGGRKLKKGGTRLDKYNDPEYIEGCRLDAKRNIIIWSR